jgi:hypothetical protein
MALIHGSCGLMHFVYQFKATFKERPLLYEVFHPSSLVNFRNPLEGHRQRELGFTTLWNTLEDWKKWA